MRAGPSMRQRVAYYGRRMRRFGWEPVASVMGETSVLTYVQGQRAATVQIRPATLQGSIITVTMAPRHTADPTANQAGIQDRSIQTDSLAPIGSPAR